MKTKEVGFFLEKLSVFGSNIETAEVDFADGLNVISGASDTGKSYICGLIDFAFGASQLPRAIEVAQPYSGVILRLKDRATAKTYEIERSLGGGDAQIRTIGADGKKRNQRTVAAKHSAENPDTLSTFLLGLSGFEKTRIRKNARGDTRTLSFRDIAFLAVVDEGRIISEEPPQLSGSVIDRTVESEVFRLLVSGIVSAVPIAMLKATTAQGLKAQLEIVAQMIGGIEAELDAIKVEPATVADELAAIDEIRSQSIRAYEVARLELVKVESELAELAVKLREEEGRLVVSEGLHRRFLLLEKHYNSDLDRFTTVREVGEKLGFLPETACPVCGAAPEAHRHEDILAHFQPQLVAAAAESERGKTLVLRNDLVSVLNGIVSEIENRKMSRENLQAEIGRLQKFISEEVQSRAHISAAQMKEQDKRRDVLLRGSGLIEQLEELKARVEILKKVNKGGKAKAETRSSLAETSEMDAFAQQVQAVLTAWKYSDAGRVVFSDKNQDLVIGNQNRADHGKGVRALTCAAFISSLMKHCRTLGLAHPGLVVLDSPLVVYRDPDKNASELKKIKQSGVKESFYQTMADGLCQGQVIVLENEDPSAALQKKINYIHFTKAKQGRYGFFPVPLKKA
jgi:hypothetical protein